MEEMKTCGTCKVQKPVSDFARKKDRYTSKCKKCHNEYYHNYWKNTEAYEKHKRRVRKRQDTNSIRAQKYGLTVAEVERITSENNGLCWLCNVRKGTCIDHCHTTGEVRGHLCAPCNKGLGFFGDDVETLRKAIEYLSRQ